MASSSFTDPKKDHHHHHHYTSRMIGQNIFALLAGIIIGSCVNMALITINSSQYMYPIPENMHVNDIEQFQSYISTLPNAGYILVFTAHYMQVLVGSYIVIIFGSSSYYIPYLIYAVTILTMIGSVINNILLLPVLPPWTWIELFFYPLIGYYMVQYYRRYHYDTSNVSIKKV